LDYGTGLNGALLNDTWKDQSEILQYQFVLYKQSLEYCGIEPGPLQ
jgi:hypothetical protein